MNRFLTPLLVAIIAAGALYWFLRTPRATVPDAGAAPIATASAERPAPRLLSSTNRPTSSLVQTSAVVGEEATSATRVRSASPPTPAAVAPWPPELAALAPITILENMRTTIRLYGSMFGGNPVGTNPEITRALQGDNPKQINFLKEDGNRVNDRGELVDAWGTPYFFHQLSATQMEIHSAGPDRIMWTADDLVIK